MYSFLVPIWRLRQPWNVWGQNIPHSQQLIYVVGCDDCIADTEDLHNSDWDLVCPGGGPKSTSSRNSPKNQFNYSPLISWRKPCRGAIPQLPEARCFEEGHHNKTSGQWDYHPQLYNVVPWDNRGGVGAYSLTKADVFLKTQHPQTRL